MFGQPAQQKIKEPQHIDEWRQEYKYFQDEFTAEQRVKEFEEIKRITEDSDNCIPIVFEWHNKSKKITPFKKRKFLVQRDVKLGEVYEQVTQLVLQTNYSTRSDIFFFNGETLLDNPNTQIGGVFDEKKNAEDNILYFVYADNAKVYEPEKKKRK